LTIQNNFTDEVIIAPLMEHYKDFAYVNYIINLEFKYGYRLFKKCLNSINIENEEKVKDKCWDMFLLEIQHRDDVGSFDDYYKSKKVASHIDSLSVESQEKEEARILKKYGGKKSSSIERVVVQ
jgi:hypothetical protein